MYIQMLSLAILIVTCACHTLHHIDSILLQQHSNKYFTLTKIDTITLNSSFSNTKSLPSALLFTQKRKQSAYPVIIKASHTYYTIEGQTVYTIQSQVQRHYSSFYSFQVPYFADVIDISDSNRTFMNISRLGRGKGKNGIGLLNLQGKIEMNEQKYGKITEFINVNSRLEKISGFVTQRGNLLFYDHKVEGDNIKLIDSKEGLKVLRINMRLVIYSKESLIIRELNGQLLHQCLMPRLQKQQYIEQVKYDDDNLRVFYVKTGKYLYTYLDNDECKPIKKYKMEGEYRFWILHNLLLVQGKVNYFFIDMQNQTVHYLDLPILRQCNEHKENHKIQVHKKVRGQYVVCRFCEGQQGQSVTIMQSYLIKLNSIEKITYEATYEKMRIPMVFVCLAIIIYMTVGRNRESPSQQNPQLMKEFESLSENIRMKGKKGKGKK